MVGRGQGGYCRNGYHDHVGDDSKCCTTARGKKYLITSRLLDRQYRETHVLMLILGYMHVKGTSCMYLGNRAGISITHPQLSKGFV